MDWDQSLLERCRRTLGCCCGESLNGKGFQKFGGVNESCWMSPYAMQYLILIIILLYVRIVFCL